MPDFIHENMFGSSESPIYSFDGEFSFLSNFYPCEVIFEGNTYPSVEHAFQAAKTLDKNIRNKIRNKETPGKAKKIGRSINLRSDWEDIKIDIMYELLNEKFSDCKLETMLIATKDRLLIEGNHWGDTFWGVYKGKGENYLGRLLMELRKEIQTELGFLKKHYSR